MTWCDLTESMGPKLGVTVGAKIYFDLFTQRAHLSGIPSTVFCQRIITDRFYDTF